MASWTNYFSAMLNVYPTERQARALKDVSDHPDSSLEQRRERLGGITRAGVYSILSTLEKNGLLSHKHGKFYLTSTGRKWLQPARRSA